ncbi:MAG TPA: UvrD-helicase domain-containing protein, partial [Thermodesulfobacteriota bacterium]|nr:UvrD-helicase domain-containing protein [Thermodesulfobacteriota bacterium]
MLKTLNATQTEAVTFGDGPLLILAGAGSGKTRVLTSRIAYLVLEKGVAPSSILAVTFTNKAAGEMRERLTRLIGEESRSLWLGTFHSLGLRLLRKEARASGVSADLTVYNEDDQLSLVKKVMAELSINEKTFSPKAILSRINQAKNENIGPSEFSSHSKDFLSERASRVYSLYQKRLREMGCMDFGDLICEPIRLLKHNPGVLKRYQERFRHVLVDEYQDTNRAQYEFTNLLASGSRNLMAVGDPDQSIYAWRGADISNILDFEKDYPDATVLRLEQNYRSTANILSAANSVIERNKKRLKKTLWTENSEGTRVVYEEARDEYNEASLVLQRLKSVVSERRLSYRDFAVFYRTNAQSRVFEEQLIREGIPYAIVGGVRFYDRKEIRDAIAYLRIISNPNDSLSLQRVINTPPRGIGKVTFEKVQKLASDHNMPLFEAFKDAVERGILNKTKVKDFIEAYEEFRINIGQLSLHELTLRYLEDSGYMMMWQEERTEEAAERVENLFELVSAIKDFETANPGATVSDFLDQAALISDIDSYEENSDKLTLMTLHSAKGLEFKVVFLAGMEEGLFPHS